MLLFLPACETTPAPPEYPLDLDPAEAARIVTGRLAGVEALRAEIDVTFETDEDSRSAGAALVARKPDRVRMQCWGPLGSTVVDLSVIGSSATLHLPREKRAIRIDLARLAGDPDTVDASYRSLLLVDSLLDELDVADLEIRREEDPSPETGALLLIEDDRPVARIVYSLRTLLPVERQRLVDPKYVIEFDDYRPFGERWWPGEIRVDEGGVRLTIEVDSMEENPDLPDALFEIRLPPGTDVESK